MKSAKCWSEEMSGETSPQIVKQIQLDALVAASELAKKALYEAGRRDEGRAASRAILNFIENL